jgi:DeoR family glycerol-3-phosphate regulon repressor
MKYERLAPVRIGHISQIDHFVTDRAPPPRLRDICRTKNVNVEIAGAT